MGLRRGEKSSCGSTWREHSVAGISARDNVESQVESSGNFRRAIRVKARDADYSSVVEDLYGSCGRQAAIVAHRDCDGHWGSKH